MARRLCVPGHPAAAQYAAAAGKKTDAPVDPLLRLIYHLGERIYHFVEAFEFLELESGVRLRLVHALADHALQLVHTLCVVLVPLSSFVEQTILLVCAAAETLDRLAHVVRLLDHGRHRLLGRVGKRFDLAM